MSDDEEASSALNNDSPTPPLRSVHPDPSTIVAEALVATGEPVSLTVTNLVDSGDFNEPVLATITDHDETTAPPPSSLAEGHDILTTRPVSETTSGVVDSPTVPRDESMDTAKLSHVAPLTTNVMSEENENGVESLGTNNLETTMTEVAGYKEDDDNDDTIVTNESTTIVENNDQVPSFPETNDMPPLPEPNDVPSLPDTNDVPLLHEANDLPSLQETNNVPSVEESNNVPFDSSSFVNQGYALWEKSRQDWLGISSGTTTSSHSSSNSTTPTASAIPLDVDDIIDVIFTSTRLRDPAVPMVPRSFPKPVPLPQMIDILVDLWEAEGLDIV